MAALSLPSGAHPAPGENPLTLDSRTPTRKVKDYLQQQTRFKMLQKSNPEDAKLLWQEAQEDADTRYRLYEYLAQRKIRAGCGSGGERARAPPECRIEATEKLASRSTKT